MRQLVLILSAILLALAATSASAQFRDGDGLLTANWQPPQAGNPLSHYLLSYTINGKADSIVTTTTNLSDASVILANVGDWALLRIRSISTFADTSVFAVSDTAYFALPTGIDPPSGITWTD